MYYGRTIQINMKQKSRSGRPPRKGDMSARVSRGISATNAPRRFIQSCFLSSANVVTSGSTTYGASNGQLVGPGATATDAAFALQFSLSDLPQASSFATIFDAYKIEKVELRFIPDANELPSASNLGSATTATAKGEFMNTAIDFDDSNAPSSLAQILEYETFQVSPPYREHKVVLRPRVAREIFDGVVTTAYEQPDKEVWLDIAQTGIPHYGVKGYIQSAGTSNNIQNVWRIYATYHVSCKQVR